MLAAALDVQHQMGGPSPIVLVNLAAALLDSSRPDEALRYAKGALRCLQPLTSILPTSLPGDWLELLEPEPGASTVSVCLSVCPPLCVLCI